VGRCHYTLIVIKPAKDLYPNKCSGGLDRSVIDRSNSWVPPEMRMLESSQDVLISQAHHFDLRDHSDGSSTLLVLGDDQPEGLTFADKRSAGGAVGN
jgi:hypothetical protein